MVQEEFEATNTLVDRIQLDVNPTVQTSETYRLCDCSASCASVCELSVEQSCFLSSITVVSSTVLTLFVSVLTNFFVSTIVLAEV